MSSSEDAVFSDLLERAKKGDRAALEQLFTPFGDEDKEGGALLAMARRMLPPDDNARNLLESIDLMQSALRVGWLDIKDFQGSTKGEFMSWLRSILRTRLLLALRRKRPQTSESAVVQAEEASGSHHRSNPLVDIVREEMRARLRSSLSKLPEDQRIVMDLRLRGFKAPEIAERLGLKPDAVRKRESRAMEKLRSLLGGGAAL